jgi:hypothetical protein
MSKPGSLGRAESGYDTDVVEVDAPAILPSLTGLKRARLRACSGGGEETLKELDVDRLALTPERPSETLSDIMFAKCVVANSLGSACARATTTGERKIGR